MKSHPVPRQYEEITVVFAEKIATAYVGRVQIWEYSLYFLSTIGSHLGELQCSITGQNVRVFHTVRNLGGNLLVEVHLVPR